ncbi:MAG: hypothetical protein JWQ16_2411 [Novosphingobium sp.]|nr:hypothetical protein [Novosphingobium sp.]
MKELNSAEICVVSGAMGGGGYSARNAANTACGDGVLGGIVAGLSGFYGGPISGMFGMAFGGLGGAIGGACMHYFTR